MGDVFNEQIVKQEPTIKTIALKVLIIVAATIITFLAFLLLAEFAAIVVVVVAFGAYYAFGFLSVEYEYIYTNGELDIDAIYNRTRRKRVFSGDVLRFEIMSPATDKNYDSSYTGAEITKNYGMGKITDSTYRFFTIYKGKKMSIFIDPNEKLMQAIATKMPRRKLIRR